MVAGGKAYFITGWAGTQMDCVLSGTLSVTVTDSCSINPLRH